MKVFAASAFVSYQAVDFLMSPFMQNFMERLFHIFVSELGKLASELFRNGGLLTNDAMPSALSTWPFSNEVIGMVLQFYRTPAF